MLHNPQLNITTNWNYHHSKQELGRGNNNELIHEIKHGW